MLSQKVFSVYCDHFVRDAMEKNEKLQAQNDKMEAARHMLVHMKIYSRGEEIVEIDLRNPTGTSTVEQEDESLRYLNLDSSEIEIPYGEIPRLYLKLSGATLADAVGNGFGQPSSYKYNPRLSLLDDETLELAFPVSEDVTICGTLKYFAGPLEDAKHMIDYPDNFIMQFLDLDKTDATTGQPVRWSANHRFNSFGHTLDGAIFALKKVQVKEKGMHSLILSDCRDVDEQQEDDELQVLAKANKNHKGLFNAALNRKELEARSVLLNKSRELLQSITAYYDGSNTLRFRLGGGSVGRMIFNDEPAWIIEPINKEESTFPITAINKFQLKLANIPWSRPKHVLNPYQPGYTRNYIVLQYTWGVDAVFFFDDSLADLDVSHLRGGFNEYFRRALCDRLDDLPVITVRFSYLHIGLTKIKPQLEALGIAANVDA